MTPSFDPFMPNSSGLGPDELRKRIKDWADYGDFSELDAFADVWEKQNIAWADLWQDENDQCVDALMRLEEAEARCRNHHLEACETCAANESETTALRQRLEEIANWEHYDLGGDPKGYPHMAGGKEWLEFHPARYATPAGEEKP